MKRIFWRANSLPNNFHNFLTWTSVQFLCTWKNYLSCINNRVQNNRLEQLRVMNSSQLSLDHVLERNPQLSSTLMPSLFIDQALAWMYLHHNIQTNLKGEIKPCLPTIQLVQLFFPILATFGHVSWVDLTAQTLQIAKDRSLSLSQSVGKWKVANQSFFLWGRGRQHACSQYQRDSSIGAVARAISQIQLASLKANPGPTE